MENNKKSLHFGIKQKCLIEEYATRAEYFFSVLVIPVTRLTPDLEVESGKNEIKAPVISSNLLEL